MDDHSRLLTAEEAGRALGLATATIRAMTRRGDIPCVRPTGKRAVRYRLHDLEALAGRRTIVRPNRG